MKIFLPKIPTLYWHLILSIGFSFLLLLVRIKISNSYFYTFLVWNLFLAFIPYALTQIAKQLKPLGTFTFVLLFITWLLFLPNSPYIITDLIHLHNEHSTLRWLDLFLIFVYAINGLILGVLSLLDMYTIVQQRYSKKTAAIVIFKVCVFSGFGIYLGRFLRFNTWDVLTKPKTLFFEILYSLQEPKVWLITLAFGGLLWVSFLVLKSVQTATVNNN